MCIRNYNEKIYIFSDKKTCIYTVATDKVLMTKHQAFLALPVHLALIDVCPMCNLNRGDMALHCYVPMQKSYVLDQVLTYTN